MSFLYCRDDLFEELLECRVLHNCVQRDWINVPLVPGVLRPGEVREKKLLRHKSHGWGWGMRVLKVERLSKSSIKLGGKQWEPNKRLKGAPISKYSILVLRAHRIRNRKLGRN